MKQNYQFNDQYFIELECIDEGNDFGLKLGEKVYATGFAACDYVHNINDANFYNDLETAKLNAIEVYKRGDFYPRVKNVVRYVGHSIHINYNEL